jgi:hypothetical protein
MSGMTKALLLALLVFCLVAPVAFSQDEPLKLKGAVWVEPVDERRIIVAVDVDGKGNADHIFLYTASQLLRVRPQMRNVTANIEYVDGRLLRVTPTVDSPRSLEFMDNRQMHIGALDVSTTRFEQTIGLSHYVPTSAIALRELAGRHPLRECNGAAKRCFEVGGQFLPFPG